VIVTKSKSRKHCLANWQWASAKSWQTSLTIGQWRSLTLTDLPQPFTDSPSTLCQPFTNILTTFYLFLVWLGQVSWLHDLSLSQLLATFHPPLPSLIDLC
jgi:hypothetical protein